MKISHTIKTALTSIKTRRGRSFLTILGIVIAISAIILVASIGSGAQSLILNEIGGIGAETIVLRPGREPSGPTDLIDTLFSDSLTDRDVQLISRKDKVPGVAAIAPAVFLTGSVAYRGETFRPTIFGMPAEFMSKTFNVFPDQGRLFGDNEIRSRATVAVIGSRVKEELFGDRDAVGEFIRIKDKNFRVIGVFAPKGQVAVFNIDELVIVPQTTAQKTLLGISHYHEILIRADRAEIVSQVVRDIERTIRESHNITDPEKDDFFVNTQQNALNQIKTITGALTAFLTSVVAIALVVGGIGVMNIMLVSVTERTKEIGLRKAVGATRNNILYQFLVESITLTTIGGVIGIILGALFGLLASFVLSRVLTLNWIFTFPIGATILAFAVSALVGLVFGLYPAYQAAKKDPIEALRYE